jgi:ubiquinone/menaquinone biosynthesis C-methylase UbiE
VSHRDVETADRALFDAMAEKYARKDMVASSRIARRDALLRAVKPELRARGTLGTVVEVGCGAAASALYLAGQYARYIGIDHSSEMIRFARDFIGPAPDVELLAANAKHTTLPDRSADTVLMVGALHHMTELDLVMAEMLRILRPGGRLICIEPHRENPVIQALRWLRTKIDADYSPDQHFFTREELFNLLREYGFQDTKLRYFTLFSQPFAQVILPPQILTAPLSRLACLLDAAIEPLLLGPLGKITWQIVASSVAPREKE